MPKVSKKRFSFKKKEKGEISFANLGLEISEKVTPGRGKIPPASKGKGRSRKEIKITDVEGFLRKRVGESKHPLDKAFYENLLSEYKSNEIGSNEVMHIHKVYQDSKEYLHDITKGLPIKFTRSLSGTILAKLKEGNLDIKTLKRIAKKQAS